MGGDLLRGPTSSPSPNTQTRRSLFSSPARNSAAARARPLSTEMHRPPVLVGQAPEDLLSDIVESANTEVYTRRFRFPLDLAAAAAAEGAASAADGEESGVNAETEEHGGADDVDGGREASLGHIITNIVVLQEFVLELVAVMQVRASMFDEVKFA
jgi:hypothetical protein